MKDSIDTSVQIQIINPLMNIQITCGFQYIKHN